MLATNTQKHDLPIGIDVVISKSDEKFAICTGIPNVSPRSDEAELCQMAIKCTSEVTKNAIIDLRGVDVHINNVGSALVVLAAKGGKVTIVTESGELPNCLSKAQINHLGNVNCVRDIDAAMTLNGITSPFSEPVDISRIAEKYGELVAAHKQSLSTLSAPRDSRVSEAGDVNCLSTDTEKGVVLKLLTKSGKIGDEDSLLTKLRELLEHNRQPGKSLILDLSEISGISDGALGVLVSTRNALRRESLQLTISDASTSVIEKLRVTRLASYFGVALRNAA
jgi:anti-anti-sigma regulatory factor